MEKICRQNIRALAAAYRDATGYTITQISRRAYGNSGCLDEFVRGKQSISLRKLDEIMSWFDANWPDGAAWPRLGAVMMIRPSQRAK